MLLCAIVILGAAAGLGLLGWFVATRVVPSMAHPAAVLGGLGGAIVLVAQSGRVLREVVAAIRRGRLDVEPAGALPENPRSPLPRG